MKDKIKDVTIKAKLLSVTRLNNSYVGNPKYSLKFTGFEGVTLDNGGFVYGFSFFRDIGKLFEITYRDSKTKKPAIITNLSII